MIYPAKQVYLAGPITGLSYDQARFGWRVQFQELLPEHIFCYSPMRGKDFLQNMTNLKGHDGAYDNVNPMATGPAIVCRDRNDVKNADAMVACFLGYEDKSLGTAIEFGWADAWRVPVIMIAEEDNPHQHLMMANMCGYNVTTLEAGAALLNQLLTPST